LIVKSPAVVINLTSYSAGAFAFSSDGWSKARSNGAALAAGALDGAGFLAGAVVDVWALAPITVSAHNESENNIRRQ
jgi:hypothetical protein